MKTAAEIADHPKARLHREVVARLRLFGSIEGAELAWTRFSRQSRLWKRIIVYGLSTPEHRAKLNRVAFPISNFTEVEAALKAGNNLNRIHDLACGRASIAADSAGSYKIGGKGLKIVKEKS
jgi:hypothetical protein